MPCCKAEKYKWCKNLDTIKVEGKEYCVFHASKEHKNQTPDNFNKLIFKRINEAIDKKEKCDLRGTIFPWEIAFNCFNKDNPLPVLDFSFSIFSGNADFMFAAFGGNAYFGLAAFSGIADFGKAAFSGDAYFGSTAFVGNAEFGSAAFSRIAYFGLATFSGDAYFRQAAFGGNAEFELASFSGDVDFKRAAFSNIADFGKAAFSGDAYFWKAAFSNIAYFGEVYFGGRTYFRKTTFNKDTSFRMCSTDKLIYFEDVDLSHVSFLDSDPLMMHFTNCKWLQKFGRNVLFDEMKMKKEQGAFEKIEYLYRRLKQKYKTENNEQQASNWHYGEKEMFRKKMNWRRFNPVSFSNLYWAFSGYGERPIRAGIVLILLFAIVTILMNVFGLISTPSGQEKFGVEIIRGFSGLIVWKKFWLLIYNTIQNAFFMKDTFFNPQTLAGTIILTVTTKLIIPIQAALFVLALR
ncbi:MAG: pentapeptide repeat-containing protein, partial [Calditrichales bacterium]|nr:pentapeptide repeat-containing protein [Calditrichales bacterium]